MHGRTLYRGYIEDDKTKGGWLNKCTDKWEREIRSLRKTSNKYPQESYAAVAHVVQL